MLLGLANRLVATTTRRRTELQALRAVGATPAQMAATLRTEAGLVGTGAAVVGLLISLVPMTALGIGLVHEPWPQGPLWAAGLICAVAGAAAYAAVMVPARQMIRTLGTP